MSSPPDLFPFGGPVEPSFELALRGYEKRQVDRYVRQVESDLAALAAEREETYAQIQLLNQHIQQLQHELVQTRRNAPSPEAVSYRHLGPRVEQILALAEDQANAIREETERELFQRRATLERAQSVLDAEANAATRQFEIALAARRDQEDKAAEQRRAALDAEVADAKAYAAKIRADIDAMYTAAQQESVRVGEATSEYVTKVRSETEAHAALLRKQLEDEVAERRAVVESQLTELQANAEEDLNKRKIVADEELAQHRAMVEEEIAKLEREASTRIQAQRAEADTYVAALRVQAEEQFAGAKTEADRLGAESVRLHTEAERVRAEADRARADAEGVVAARGEAESQLLAARTEAETVLAEARTTAEAILAGARTECETVLAAARMDAEAVVTGARTEAEAAVTDARTQAMTLRAEATAEAAAIVEAAQANAEAAITAANERAESLLAEAEALLEEVKSEAGVTDAAEPPPEPAPEATAEPASEPTAEPASEAPRTSSGIPSDPAPGADDVTVTEVPDQRTPGHDSNGYQPGAATSERESDSAQPETTDTQPATVGAGALSTGVTS